MEPGGKTRARIDLQFCEDGSHMIFDSTYADVQGFTNFLVCEPTCYGFRDLQFAGTQPPVGCVLGAGRDHERVALAASRSFRLAVAASVGSELGRSSMKQCSDDACPGDLQSTERGRFPAPYEVQYESPIALRVLEAESQVMIKIVGGEELRLIPTEIRSIPGDQRSGRRASLPCRRRASVHPRSGAALIGEQGSSERACQ